MLNHPDSNLLLYCLLTVIASAAAIVWLLWLGLKRASLPQPSRIRTIGFVTFVVIAWYGAFSALAARGFFQASPVQKIPTLPFAVGLPILLGAWYAFRSQPVRKAVQALPLAWLIGVQFYRVIGLIFVLYTINGQLPGVFGYPAGYGDIGVGLLALVTAWMLATNAPLARPAAWLWNGLGILDFAVALATGFLSSPTPLQRLALDHPNIIVTAYPLVTIPIFLVPLSSILHILSLWKLQQQPQAAPHRDASPSALPHPSLR